MHYAIFIPGADDPATASARPWLAALARDRQPEFSPVANGPDRSRGLFATWSAAGARPTTPARWVWTKAPGADYWLGAHPEQPVTAACIAREKQQPGVAVELADGARWTIPVLDHLPGRYGLDASGKPAKLPAPEFAKYRDGVAMLATSFCRAGGAIEMERLSGRRPDLVADAADVTAADWYRVCIDALGINYRVNHAIADWLGLLDDGAFFRIIGTAARLPEILSDDYTATAPTIRIPVT